MTNLSRGVRSVITTHDRSNRAGNEINQKVRCILPTDLEFETVGYWHISVNWTRVTRRTEVLRSTAKTSVTRLTWLGREYPFVAGKALEARDFLGSFNKNFRYRGQATFLCSRGSTKQWTYIPFTCLCDEFTWTTDARIATESNRAGNWNGRFWSGYLVFQTVGSAEAWKVSKAQRFCRE